MGGREEGRKGVRDGRWVGGGGGGGEGADVRTNEQTHMLIETLQ